MSYERPIGFGINPENPKGPVRPLSTKESGYLKRMGVAPIPIDLDRWMPERNREPEPKLFVEGTDGFERIQNLITNAQNGFLIPNQSYKGKHPLVSLLIDTNPSAVLDPLNLSLRYRFEINPETGVMSRADFNEKSGMTGGTVIGGCIDRYEREFSQSPDQTPRQAYYEFIQKYRQQNDPAFCDKVRFDDLCVGAGYICVRNEVGFAVKHPVDDVLFVFELCEDIWNDTTPDITDPIHKYYEAEFEFKQAWGNLPRHIKKPDDFKRYVYETMTMVQLYLHMNTPGSSINMKSKAEISKDNFSVAHGIDPFGLQKFGMASAFDYAAMMGGAKTLEQTMKESASDILRMGTVLYKEMAEYNQSLPEPSIADIGYGHMLIRPDASGNSFSGPVAAYR